MNARGVQLSSSDLLKNYFFSIVDKELSNRNEIEEIEFIWSKILDKLEGNKFEEFLRYYWNSHHKTTRKTELFKNIRKEIKNKQQVFQLLRLLDENVDIYKALLNPEDVFWQGRIGIIKSLKEIKLFQIKQVISLYLSAYKYLDINEFERLLKICSIISFRYNIIGGLNPNEQEEVYNKMAIEIVESKKFEIENLFQIYVNDENFVNDFTNKQFKNTSRNHKIVKYILSKIELYKYKHELNYESDLCTVEHILPESKNEIWTDFTDEEINRSKYRLGNLTLLESKLNKEADRNIYELKKEVYNKSSINLCNKIAEEFNSWSEENIILRQKELAKDAKAIWRIDF